MRILKTVDARSKDSGTVLSVIVRGLVLLCSAYAQPGSPKATFEVATVKVSNPETSFVAPIKSSNPTRLTYRNYRLRGLMAEAYGIGEYQVRIPSPNARDIYDITAIKDRGTTPEVSRSMLQSLLIDRFHIQMHYEEAEMPAYVLLPGRDNSKLRPEHDAPNVPGCKSFGTLSELAGVLSLILNKPVVNKTGIEGTYYFILYVVPGLSRTSGDDGNSTPAPPPAAAPPPCPGWTAATMPPPAENIFDAVKLQMGLRLVREGNAKVRLLVVDRADRTPEKN